MQQTSFRGDTSFVTASVWCQYRTLLIQLRKFLEMSTANPHTQTDVEMQWKKRNPRRRSKYAMEDIDGEATVYQSMAVRFYHVSSGITSQQAWTTIRHYQRSSIVKQFWCFQTPISAGLWWWLSHGWERVGRRANRPVYSRPCGRASCQWCLKLGVRRHLQCSGDGKASSRGEDSSAMVQRGATDCDFGQTACIWLPYCPTRQALANYLGTASSGAVGWT